MIIGTENYLGIKIFYKIASVFKFFKISFFYVYFRLPFFFLPIFMPPISLALINKPGFYGHFYLLAVQSF